MTLPASLRSDRSALALTVGALVAYDVVRRVAIPGDWHFAANLGALLVIIGLCRLFTLSTAELGLSRAAVPAGLRLGLLAVVLIGAAVTIAALFIDDLGSLGRDPAGLRATEVWWDAMVEIPLATVLLEELAFRGLLAALLERMTTLPNAIALQATLFGLWHVPGAWSSGALAVIGTVAATAAGGAVFHLMKWRSRSLIAPAFAHWATNGLALLIVWALR